MKNKLKISDLSIKSFVTKLGEKSEDKLLGGGHCGASNDRTGCRACVSGHWSCDCD